MFEDALKEMVTSVSGGQAAVVMGFDGIPMAMFAGDEEPDIETIGMEFSVLLKEVKKASEMIESGQMEEVTVRTEKMTTILRVINNEYFVAMVIVPQGNLGKTRYALRMLSPKLNRELS